MEKSSFLESTYRNKNFLTITRLAQYIVRINCEESLTISGTRAVGEF
jgi:hypothetical protein